MVDRDLGNEKMDSVSERKQIVAKEKMSTSSVVITDLIDKSVSLDGYQVNLSQTTVEVDKQAISTPVYKKNKVIFWINFSLRIWNILISVSENVIKNIQRI